MISPQNAPESAQGLLIAGQSLLERGQSLAAASFLVRALDLEPARADIHFYLGYSFHLAGDLDRAVDCYERALGLDPDLADAHYNLGRARRPKLDPKRPCTVIAGRFP